MSAIFVLTNFLLQTLLVVNVLINKGCFNDCFFSVYQSPTSLMDLVAYLGGEYNPSSSMAFFDLQAAPRLFG